MMNGAKPVRPENTDAATLGKGEACTQEPYRNGLNCYDNPQHNPYNNPPRCIETVDKELRPRQCEDNSIEPAGK
jgi:hypothetical protein